MKTLLIILLLILAIPWIIFFAPMILVLFLLEKVDLPNIVIYFSGITLEIGWIVLFVLIFQYHLLG
jgi:hypothetical protein